MKKHTLATFSLSLFFALLCWSVSDNLYFFHLGTIDGDGLTHYHQLKVMLEGIQTVNLIDIFTFNLNYGFFYFVLNLIVSLPAILFNQLELYVFLPRAFHAVFATGSIGFVYATIYRRSKQPNHALILSILIATMPIFWTLPTIFRPDWFMTFWLTGAVYYFYKDSFSFSRDFTKACIFTGIAIAAKTQALVFYPFVGVYLLIPFIHAPSIPSLYAFFRHLARFSALHIATFFILNPHALHPIGLYAIWRRFYLEMRIKNNATSLSNIGEVVEGARSTSLSLRLETLSSHIVHWPMIILLVITLIVSMRILYLRKKDVTACLSVYLIVYFSYLLFYTNVPNSNFYICGIVFAPILFDDYFRHKHLSIRYVILSIIIAFNLSNIVNTPTIYTHTDYLQSHPEAVKNEAFILEMLTPIIQPGDHILTQPSIGFNFQTLSLTHRHIHYIWGTLTPQHILPSGFKKKWESLEKLQSKFAKTLPKIRHFKPKKIIILSKKTNDIHPSLRNEKGIKGYRLLGENTDISIFIKHSKTLERNVID